MTRTERLELGFEILPGDLWRGWWRRPELLLCLQLQRPEALLVDPFGVDPECDVVVVVKDLG
jgi:hypothetical protein